MAMNITKKILSTHLAKPSDMVPGQDIFLKVDQTLTHDINAVMTYLAFEQVGLDRAIWTTTCCTWIIRRRTTTFTCSPLPSGMACMFQDPATESATRSMWPDSALPESFPWAATAIRPTAVPSVCCASV